MTSADRLRSLMAADPRRPADKAKAAGMKSRQEWHQYANGIAVPGLIKAAAILEALGRKWADLDEPIG